MEIAHNKEGLMSTPLMDAKIWKEFKNQCPGVGARYTVVDKIKYAGKFGEGWRYMIQGERGEWWVFIVEESETRLWWQIVAIHGNLLITEAQALCNGMTSAQAIECKHPWG